MRRLLDDLLALARTEASLDQDPPESLAVGEFLAHTLTESGRDPALLTVTADGMISGPQARPRARVRQSHGQRGPARQRTGIGHGAALRHTAAGTHVEVLIDDHGPGVPPEDRERIFERFATRPTARGSAAGTGLGLALVRETVSAHGGTVRCVERPGGGARFVVALPREA